MLVYNHAQSVLYKSIVEGERRGVQSLRRIVRLHLYKHISIDQSIDRIKYFINKEVIQQWYNTAVNISSACIKVLFLHFYY